MKFLNYFWLFVKRNKILWLPGTIVTLIFVMYSLIYNSSFSYMGNTSSKLTELVLDNYKLLIIGTLLKIFLSYLVIGIFLNLFFYYTYQSLEKLLKTKFSLLKYSILISLSIFIFSLFQFFKKLIHYPQMFDDNFYLKNSLFQNFQEFLTDYFSPDFFGWIQTFIFLTGTILILYSFVHIIFNNRKKIKDWFFKYKKITRVFASVILALFLFFMIKDLTFFAKQEKQPLNVILLASDALRLDHFSAYGYHRKTTPFIDQLTQSGTSFANIYTTVPRTFPSWVSILTSRLPMDHGIRHMFPSTKTRNQNFKTLATFLKEKGYQTALFGDFAADIFPRIELGFDKVSAPDFNFPILIKQMLLKIHPVLLSFLLNSTGMQVFPYIKEFSNFADPKIVSKKILKEIKNCARNKKPFFITSFFSVTHFPFSAPYPFYKKFSDPKYYGPYKYFKNIVLNQMQKITAKDEQQVRDLYDGGLYAFDLAVEEIVEALKDQGLLENTLVVILSDHGENLYEENYGLGHGEHLQGPYGLKIPLIFYGKTVEKNKIDYKTASIIDITPTILDYLGFQEIPGNFQGQSLLRGLDRKIQAYSETGIWFENTSNLFFQKQRIMYPDVTGISTIDFGYKDEVFVMPEYDNLIQIAKHRMIISGNYKLIYTPMKDRVEYQLYNLKNDPKEKKDLSKIDKSKLREMKEIFFERMKKDSNIVIKNEYLIPAFNEPVF